MFHTLITLCLAHVCPPLIPVPMHYEYIIFIYSMKAIDTVFMIQMTEGKTRKEFHQSRG